MVFIRIKKIKKNNYAYLVENKWKKGKAHQKVKAYLGRVIELDEKDLPFDFDLSNASFKDSVTAILGWQARKFGFSEKDSSFVKENMEINIPKKNVLLNNNSIAIKSNDGFFCEHTIKDLYKFNAKGNEEDVGYALARVFVDAGINIPKDTFIEIFEKIMKVE